MPNQNIRRRNRLMKAQEGKCFYCTREVHAAPQLDKTRLLDPVVEHYIPRHAGGVGENIRLVLACHQCDKMKGMISGPDFEAVLAEFLSKHQGDYKKAQPFLAMHCKKLNGVLARQYPPGITQDKPKPPPRPRIVYDYPREYVGPKLGELLGRSMASAGASGKEAFIAEGESRRAVAQGRHWESMTGIEPVRGLRGEEDKVG